MTSAQLDSAGNRSIQENEAVYCPQCGWRHRPGKGYGPYNCPDCGVFDALCVAFVEVLIEQEKAADGWVQPCGEEIRFRDVLDVKMVVSHRMGDIPSDNDPSLHFTLPGDSISYAIPGEVNDSRAQRAIRRWRNYTDRLVHCEPFPGTEDATKAGCVCCRPSVHDPDCPVALAYTPQTWEFEGGTLDLDTIGGISVSPSTKGEDTVLATVVDREGINTRSFAMKQEIADDLKQTYLRRNRWLHLHQKDNTPDTWIEPNGDILHFKDCHTIEFPTAHNLCVTALDGSKRVFSTDPGDGTCFKLSGDSATRLLSKWGEYVRTLSDHVPYGRSGRFSTKPRPKPETPALGVIPIPTAKGDKDSHPQTKREHICFVAGAGRMISYLNQIGHPIRHDDIASFWDTNRVPTVKCGGCYNRIPLERSSQHEGYYVGIDCCLERVKEREAQKAKEDAEG